MVSLIPRMHGLLLLLSPWVLAMEDHYPHLRHDLETDTMITLAGYKAETHKIFTADDYILTVHRIVGSGPVVFMNHGLEDSSSAWVLAGPDHGAPGFRLAEQGYDVWLGNARGNHYSRQHVTLDPDHDEEYWHYTWDEMAKYDLPAELNYVMNITGKEKIYYVGHSMGSTTFMTMNSLDQSWADKVELAVFLGPAAYMDHMKSPIKLIAPFADMVNWIADHLGMGEFLPSNWFMDMIAEYTCGDSPAEFICENIIFLLAGYDKEQMNKTMLPTIAHHCPAGISTYTVLQYAQEYKHKNYGGFDWGSDEKNMAHHGSVDPPVYNLKNVNTKVALFWGDNDWLVAEEDLFKIMTQVPNVVDIYQIPWEGWNHLDFLYAIDIDIYQNQHLIELLAKYPID